MMWHFNSFTAGALWGFCLTDALLLTYFGRRWWRATGIVVLIAVMWLPVQDAANATTKVEGGPATVANHRYCEWFRVKVQDYGTFDNLLWDLQQKVTFCHNRSRTKVNYIRRTWGQTTPGLGWTIASHRLSGDRAANYSWYSRRVSAVFNGWAGPISVTCQPYAKTKVYATGRIDYATGKGC